MPRGSRTELRAILFTDVVDSTRIARDLGDERWSALLHRERRLIRERLKQFEGREIDTAGDGLFALFASPAAAVRCAFATVADVQALGVDIRAGVHFGEIEISGGGAHGIVVHTAARVMSLGQPAQVLVTSTIKDLVAGARFSLEERGVFELKGVPGDWTLYDVTAHDDRLRPSPLTAEEADRRRQALPSSTKRRRILVPGIAAALVVVAAVALAIWLSNRGGAHYIPGVDTVARIDPTGRFETPIRVGSYPIGLAFVEGRLWVIDQGSQDVYRIDLTNHATTSRGLSGVPTGIAGEPGVVWVTNGFGAGADARTPVSRIDPNTLQITSPWQAPTGSASIAAGAGAVWVADGLRARVLRFDPVTAAERAVNVPTGTPGSSGSRLSSVVVGGSPHEYVWVVDALGTTIHRIDPSNLTGQQTFQIGGTPTRIAVADGAVWVTSEQGDDLFELDASTGATQTTVDLARVGCNAPTGLAIGSGGVWVACSLSREVVEINPSTADVVARLPVGGSPDAMTVDDEAQVWVAVHSA